MLSSDCVPWDTVLNDALAIPGVSNRSEVTLEAIRLGLIDVN
jgi:hypothetical protein